MKPHQPWYQTKGLAMGCRAVMGLGWVGTVAEEISAILELQKLEFRTFNDE
jgi:riboflavin synthase